MTTTLQEVEQLPDDELRDIALTAEACITLEAARLYGFITGGPGIDVERCEAVAAIAVARGLKWTRADIDERAARFVRAFNAEARA